MNDGERRRIAAWLRDTDEGRDVVAKAAARMCQSCPRVRRLMERCAACEHKTRPRTTGEILDMLPPHSLDAEQAIIGSVLLEPAVLRKVKQLAPADFYSFANAAIWARIREFADMGQPIDTTLLAERLKETGEYDDVGGAAYLAELLHSVAVPAHAAHYAEIVRRKAELRRLACSLCEALKAVYEPGASVKSVKDALANVLKESHVH